MGANALEGAEGAAESGGMSAAVNKLGCPFLRERRNKS